MFRLETEWGWHFNLYVDRMWGSPGAVAIPGGFNSLSLGERVGGGHSTVCSCDTEGNSALLPYLEACCRQGCLSSNPDKIPALYNMQPACLPVWICRYFSREERNQMREQVHSYSMCILWFCRFFHSKCSSEVSLVTKPKWVKEVFDS